MELIKGTYTAKDAIRIISELTEVKIKFHEENINKSCNEEDIEMRENRIIQLQNELRSLKKYLAALNDYITIKAQIQLNRKNTLTPRLNLIEGTFDPIEAKQILQDVYRSKISFHTMSAFSKAERGESGVELHEKRIEELKKDMDHINTTLNNAELAGCNISIRCKIDIHVEEPQLQLSKQAIGNSN